MADYNDQLIEILNEEFKPMLHDCRTLKEDLEEELSKGIDIDRLLSVMEDAYLLGASHGQDSMAVNFHRNYNI